MKHNAWSSLDEMPYYFLRPSVKFRGHTAKKIVAFYPNWAFLNCNLSLNSPMATKWCTKLKVAWKRCPVVYRGHPSNFKVTRAKKNRRFESNLNKITRPVAAIKSHRFALLFILCQGTVVGGLLAWCLWGWHQLEVTPMGIRRPR